MPPEPTRLQTPRENRTVFVEPAFDQLGELIGNNRAIQQRFDSDWNGRSFAQIVRQARQELLDAARRWTGTYRNVPFDHHGADGLFFLAGHQPRMFHPGVWLKNFVLSDLAHRHGAIAVNLVVDSDVLGDPTLRVPGGTAASPEVLSIPFDRPNPQIPFEERRIEEPEQFATFGDRVAEQIAPLVSHPLLEKYWPLVCKRTADTQNLGACLAQARHQLEGDWGLQSLEVPQSEVCSGEAFQRFIAYLLARLAEFRTIHNETLQEYRREHRMRSVSHPAPDLIVEEDWLESPFWVWTASEPRRRRLFARTVGDEIVLSDRQAWEARLPLQIDGDATRAVDSLMDLQRNGVRIRSRALMTTLWARMVLGDVFIHGIGGAKYDRVTDQLMRRFFHMEPPGFLVVSGTLLLPIVQNHPTTDDPRSIEKELRELLYHPERHLIATALGATSDAANDVPYAWITHKQRWVETTQTIENAKQRCHAIREANTALQPWVSARREELLQCREIAKRRLRAEDLLTWREYAFCLHPESNLRNFFLEILHKTG